MKKKFICLFIFNLLLILFAFNTCNANNINSHFSLSCSNSSIQANKNFSIALISYFPYDNNISAFRINLEFDTSKFTFKSIVPKGNIASNEIKYSIKDNVLTAIYLTSNHGIDTPKNNDIEFCCFNFKSKSDCDASSSTISAKLDGVCDYNINEIVAEDPEPITINIVDTAMSDCSLKALVPSEGSLSPAFDPQIYDYDLDVSYSTKSINFDAIPASNSAAAKISRKNLNGAGTSTLIKVTVTDTATKDKCLYNISVNRASKPISDNQQADNSSNNSKNSGTHKNNNSYNSSSGTYNKNHNSDSSSSRAYNKNHNNTDDTYSNEDNNINDSNNPIENDNPDDLIKDCNSSASNENSSGENNNFASKTIVVKENKFNIFFAGVCLSCLIFIIGYIIYNKIGKHTNNNLTNNI